MAELPEPRWEWGVTGLATTLHVVDVNVLHNTRSGPRALCKRYPQRKDFPWFSLGIHEKGLRRAAAHYGLTFCPDCEEATRDLLGCDPQDPHRQS